MAKSSIPIFANVAAASTDSNIVTAVSQMAIKVVSVAFVTGGTSTTSTFNSKGSGAGTAISCLFANGANGGAVLSRNEDGWFITNTSEALTLTTGSGSSTGVLVNYILV